MIKQPIFRFLQIGLCTCAYLSATSDITLAQVTSDNTVNTKVNQNGSVAEITGGTTRGDNLFHSFREFSVRTGNEAFFNNADSIANIFSRVTGGKVSEINGLIRANGSASLFLINPQGIIFGENARLDIGGSFYGSSASSILFEDGEFSAADLENPPLLTVNAPVGLGFRDNPGDIENNSVANEGRGLEVDTGKNITLVGGNVTFNGGNIVASGGRVELGGLTDNGTIRFNENDSLDFPQDITRGNVSLTQGASVNVTSGNGGFVTVNANNLEISDGSAIIAGIGANLGTLESQAGDITLNVADKLTIQGEADTASSRISNLVNLNGSGNAGDIIIDTVTLEGKGNFVIGSATFGQGNAGQVIVNASKNISFEGLEGFSSGIASAVAPLATGNGNDIIINTSSLSLSKRTQLATSTVGKGNAGNILVDASDSISLNGGSVLQAASFGQGNGGNIELSTTNLTLNDGSKVTASTFGEGNAGKITINASGTISADGELSGGFASGIFSQVSESGVGNSGGIDIQTTNLTLTKGGIVSGSTFS